MGAYSDDGGYVELETLVIGGGKSVGGRIVDVHVVGLLEVVLGAVEGGGRGQRDDV